MRAGNLFSFCCRLRMNTPPSVRWWDSDLEAKQKEIKRKTKCAALGEPNTAQSVVLQRAEAFYRMAAKACTHSSCRIYIPTINWRSANYRSARDLFSQFSHSFECGAVRFLFWWLFLHRRLRSGNEAQLSLSRFAPFGGSLPPGAIRFYSDGSRKSRNLL